MSESTRYQALNDSIFTARGEDILIDIAGPERLSLQTESIAPESACTSMQLHLQVSPAEFARNWNAAQVLAGPQLALGANSPYFFGHQLWAETRIELFAQATDTRPDELKTQGVRPRVWFGERWITSIFDLFEENVRYFPSLLPELSDEDPVAELADGPHPAAGRTAAAQRHHLPVEPAGVRRGRRQATPAGGEPRAARRADRGGHDGQRGVLLRHAADAVRRGPATVDEDEFRCGTTQFPRGRTAWDGGAAVLARPWRGDARRVGAAPAAADGRRGSASLGGRGRGARPVPRRDRGPRQDRTQRRGLAGVDRAGAAGTRA